MRISDAFLGRDDADTHVHEGVHGAFDAVYRAFIIRSLAVFLISGLLLSLLLPRLLLFVQLSTDLLTWRWQFDYDEGINLNAALQLAQGHGIYGHNGPGSFLAAPYPPLFYLLNAPGVWLLGPSFTVGRAISLLSTVLIAALIAYVVWKVSSWGPGPMPVSSSAHPVSLAGMGHLMRLLPGLAAGALWLSLSPVIVWSALYKQDMLALALGLAGLAWTLKYSRQRPTLNIYFVAPLLFACAFYTKQSALSAAVATMLWLLFRDWRSGVRTLFVLTVLLVAPFIAANLATEGGLWEHLVANHSMPWDTGGFQRMLRRAWGEYWPLIALGGVSLLCIFRSAAPKKVDDGAARGMRRVARAEREYVPAPTGSLLVLYTLTGVGSTLVQMGYEGANFNHLLDGLLPLCILCGLLMARVWQTLCIEEEGSRPAQQRTNLGKQVFSANVLVLSWVLLLAQVGAYKDPRTWFYSRWPDAESDTQMRQVAALVANTPGDIYSEDVYLLVSNGHRVLYDDPSTFVPLANLGRWDDTALNRALVERRFKLVLFWDGSRRWTLSGRRAFQNNYVVKLHGKLAVYEPRRPALFHPPLYLPNTPSAAPHSSSLAPRGLLACP